VIEEKSQGGGLRVNSITNYAGNDKITKKIFSYKTTTGMSSGILMTPPQHLSQYGLTETKTSIMPTGVFVDTYQSFYLNGYSTPYIPFSNSAQGGHVGYSYVEEKTVESGNEGNNNGTISYSFINKADNASNLTDRMIKGFPAISYQENGTPLETCYFDKSMKLIKKKTFEYSAKQEGRKIKGLRVFRLPMVNSGMTIKYYDLLSERWHLIRATESDYQENETEPVITVTEYGYNSANLLANYEKVTGSKNNTIEKDIKYPVDFSSALYNEMKSKHLVNMPIDIITNITVNNQTTEIFRTHKEYIKDPVKTKNLILTGKIESSSSGVSDLLPYVTFNQYDNKGSIQQVTERDGIPVCYLWSYNGQYPIAEIKNAAFTEIEAAAKTTFSITSADALSALTTPDEAKLKDGSLQRALPNALVTTYTYKPLVGMITATDPSGVTTYYEYDDFGRLKETYIYKDNIIAPANKQAVQKYDYHYRNQ
jgi:YD repeat-containing protein